MKTSQPNHPLKTSVKKGSKQVRCEKKRKEAGKKRKEAGKKKSHISVRLNSNDYNSTNVYTMNVLPNLMRY
ncbi:MAG: hypothetical protein RIC19_08820 [Phaeodactylibacter sp.]|uniref:hypothetical protein n=1 Tax=Phaeodactylibacter sp. TaxID=1940289 RepID=UPI0032EE826C